MEFWMSFSKTLSSLKEERPSKEATCADIAWTELGQRRGGAAVATREKRRALSRSSDGSHTHFLFQCGGLVGPCVPQHFSCPERLRALRAGDIHQDSEMAELILEPFRFFLRKTESDEGSGISAKGRRLPRHHESMKERLRPDEETYGRNQHRAEF